MYRQAIQQWLTATDGRLTKLAKRPASSSRLAADPGCKSKKRVHWTPSVIDNEGKTKQTYGKIKLSLPTTNTASESPSPSSAQLADTSAPRTTKRPGRQEPRLSNPQKSLVKGPPRSSGPPRRSASLKRDVKVPPRAPDPLRQGPPPAPRPARLPTPDLSDDDLGGFCACCSGICCDQHSSQKMNAQIRAALAHISGPQFDLTIGCTDAMTITRRERRC